MDPELSAHLTQQHLSAAIYGFEALMSLCASWSPLSEVIPLWDYLLTFGPHHVVFLFLAHMQLRREELLGCHSAGGLQKLLKTSPAEGWQAGRICRQAAHLAKSCDPKLYERVRRHTINPTVG
jgi:cell cycle arrest protein BUB2